MIFFLRANGLQGPFEGPVPENRDFFGPLNGYEQRESHFGAKKVSILRDHPSNCPRNPFARRKIIMYWAVRKASAYVDLCT